MAGPSICGMPAQKQHHGSVRCLPGNPQHRAAVQRNRLAAAPQGPGQRPSVQERQAGIGGGVKVQGSRKTPYKVEIRISPLSEEKCQAILRQCGRRIENLEALAEGNFPEDLKELFLGPEGLFPTPKEISFTCSCPDWALMCKHVAAALYGVGARLDTQPALFFELRGIDMERFLDVAVANKVEAMLVNAQKPSDRILDGADLDALFGVL